MSSIQVDVAHCLKPTQKSAILENCQDTLIFAPKIIITFGTIWVILVMYKT